MHTTHFNQDITEESDEPRNKQDLKSLRTNEINFLSEVPCRCACRLRAIIRLVISSLGFTFLVSGIAVAIMASSDEGKKYTDFIMSFVCTYF